MLTVMARVFRPLALTLIAVLLAGGHTGVCAFGSMFDRAEQTPASCPLHQTQSSGPALSESNPTAVSCCAPAERRERQAVATTTATISLVEPDLQSPGGVIVLDPARGLRRARDAGPPSSVAPHVR